MTTSDGDAREAVRSEDERELEEDDLRSGLGDLARLGSVRLPLEELLTRVAHLAVRAIPGADGAGLALLEEGRSNTLVATSDFVGVVDDVQYGLGEGPCIAAAMEERTVLSRSLGGDPRWRRFGGRVARMGVHSALALPLHTPDGVVGVMNIYAHAKDAFDARSAELGELFATPAAIAVQNAQVLEQTRRLVAQLTATLETRMVIERAIGIMMSRSGVTEEQALERLRALSQQEHQKLVTVARRLVDEAVRRARSQHG